MQVLRERCCQLLHFVMDSLGIQSVESNMPIPVIKTSTSAANIGLVLRKDQFVSGRRLRTRPSLFVYDGRGIRLLMGIIAMALRDPYIRPNHHGVPVWQGVEETGGCKGEDAAAQPGAAPKHSTGQTSSGMESLEYERSNRVAGR